MFYLKIKEKDINYNNINIKKYIEIIKNFNKDIQNNNFPILFNHLKNKIYIEDKYISFLMMLIIIDEIGNIDKVKKKVDNIFSEIKNMDDNNIVYKCSLLLFYNSLYNMDVLLFDISVDNMICINDYYNIKEDLDEFFNFLDETYGFDENIISDLFLS